jgi:hypothetical protein
MSLRKLLIAAALLIVLGGGVWWSHKRQAAEEAKPKKEDASTPKILAVPDDQLAQLTLKRKDAEEVVLKKNAANKWEMVKPKPYRVDADTASAIANAINPLTSTQVVDEKPANLAPFGLDSPAFELTVTKKDGKTQKLLIGDEAPAGGDVYAKLEGDPRVFTIASFGKTSLDKTAQDLRDKKLLTFDSDKLTRVELDAKKQQIEFGKNNQNEWQILKPQPLRADGWQVEELIRRLRDAKMDTVPSDEDLKKAVAAFASGTPVATAKVTDNNGTQSIEVRKVKDDYYAKSSVVEGAYKVPNDLGQGLDKSLDDFRNKKLFDFGFSDPTKVDVVKDGKTVSYAKSGDKWFSGPKQIDSATLQSFIDKLRDLAAAKFVEMPFNAPSMQVTVTAKDGKLVDKVLIAKQGNDWLAKRENEPVVYQLDNKAAEDLNKAFTEIKEAAPETKKK